MGQMMSLQKMVLERLDLHMQQRNRDTDTAPFTQVNSEWIPDLHVKHKTTKLLEDKTDGNLEGLEYEDAFLGTTPEDNKAHERNH